MASNSTASMPAMPKTAVKMSSTKTLAKLAMGAAQPRISAAAAGEEQVASVTKAGEVLLKKPQQANCKEVSFVVSFCWRFSWKA